MGIKTIIISILIIVVINCIVHFLKDSFTQPMIKYIDPIPSAKPIVHVSPDPPTNEVIHSEISIPDMKDELNDFLLSINI